LALLPMIVPGEITGFVSFDLDNFEVYATIVRQLAAALKSVRLLHRMQGALHDLTSSLQKLRMAMEGAIQAMAITVEIRDPYTAGHQKRVAQLACAIAQKMDLPPGRIDGIRLAASIHDIGKLCIPAEILIKPGPIPPIEFSLIETHPQVGYDILKNIDFPWPIADIVLQHHRRIDGSGYPRNLSADLLVESKILGVADVVEAMSSYRPYRPALGIEKALEEIEKNSGILYDPVIVSICSRLFADHAFQFENTVD
jgi:HD-GYP domain-containing protein (c-di-GMP phosphodiesterase class II)